MGISPLRPFGIWVMSPFKPVSVAGVWSVTFCKNKDAGGLAMLWGCQTQGWQKTAVTTSSTLKLSIDMQTVVTSWLRAKCKVQFVFSSAQLTDTMYSWQNQCLQSAPDWGKKLPPLPSPPLLSPPIHSLGLPFSPLPTACHKLAPNPAKGPGEHCKQKQRHFWHILSSADVSDDNNFGPYFTSRQPSEIDNVHVKSSVIHRPNKYLSYGRETEHALVQ